MGSCCKFGTTGKSVRFRGIVSSLMMKNILLYRSAHPWSNAPSPRRQEGRSRDRHGSVARVAMAAAASGVLHRAKRLQRTAKSCGPGAATVASILAGPCWRGNGDKKRRSPGRVRISRKTIARGKPGCLGCTCSSTRVLFSTGLFAHGTAGAVGARLSLRPCVRKICQNERTGG
jgi:hypothetical protein